MKTLLSIFLLALVWISEARDLFTHTQGVQVDTKTPPPEQSTSSASTPPVQGGGFHILPYPAPSTVPQDGKATEEGEFHILSYPYPAPSTVPQDKVPQESEYHILPAPAPSPAPTPAPAPSKAERYLCERASSDDMCSPKCKDDGICAFPGSCLVNCRAIAVRPKQRVVGARPEGANIALAADISAEQAKPARQAPAPQPAATMTVVNDATMRITPARQSAQQTQPAQLVKPARQVLVAQQAVPAQQIAQHPPKPAQPALQRPVATTTIVNGLSGSMQAGMPAQQPVPAQQTVPVQQVAALQRPVKVDVAGSVRTAVPVQQMAPSPQATHMPQPTPTMPTPQPMPMPAPRPTPQPKPMPTPMPAMQTGGAPAQTAPPQQAAQATAKGRITLQQHLNAPYQAVSYAANVAGQQAVNIQPQRTPQPVQPLAPQQQPSQVPQNLPQMPHPQPSTEASVKLTASAASSVGKPAPAPAPMPVASTMPAPAEPAADGQPTPQQWATVQMGASTRWSTKRKERKAGRRETAW